MAYITQANINLYLVLSILYLFELLLTIDIGNVLCFYLISLLFF